VVGPHPYPMIVRDFQSIIGIETKEQLLEIENKEPDYIIACVGGGSNAIGIFYPFINRNTKLIGVEAAGFGLNTGKHSATLTSGTHGIFHGMKTYLLQNDDGQISKVHSISAGLDYPGVGPEHSYLKSNQLVKYDSITDDEALAGVTLLSEKEGIIPALETAHAVAYLEKLMPDTNPDEIIVINISGRGDKDLSTIMDSYNKDYCRQKASRRESVICVFNLRFSRS
jgi:tryptophan synthase beta chain